MDPFRSNSFDINLTGGGNSHLQELIRSTDWSKTAIGPRSAWPHSLRVALDIILHAGYPMFIWWGPELNVFYNEAYIAILGEKHPDALAKSAREVWSENWPLIADQVAQVLQGQECHIRDRLAYLDRRGFREEAYWTFSLSPVLNEQGKVAGIFGVCNDESLKMRQERRHENIGKLSSAIFRCKELSSRAKAVIEVLMENSRDILCAALYTDQPGNTGRYFRIACCDVSREEKIFPEMLDLAGNEGPYHSVIREVQKNKKLATTDQLQHLLSGLKSEMGDPVETIAVVPLLKPGREEISGLLLCGLSPHLEWEDNYRNYLNLAAAQISTGITDARELAEKQLQEKEEKLRLAVEATNLGTWDYYPLRGVLQWSDTCKEIFGIPVSEKITYQKFLDVLHEEDRERTDQSVQAALKKREHYDIEYRVIRRTDGEERWIRATGKAYFNELEEAYRFIGTALDITDRKLAEEQKNDFLRIAGHELRTPLTSIVGYLGLLQRMISESDQARPFLDKSLQSTLKMRGLISDFLDISKVERGELSFNMKKVNLSDLVLEIISNINIPPAQHPLELHIEPDLYIYGDEERLEQVVLNLLNNAQKYSPKDQIINIDLSSGKEKVLLRIKDKGVGMQQKEVERIFQKFYRGESGARVKGMGLGLYIVKKIIDYHGGEIRVQTVPEKGSQFTVEFPVFQNKPV